MKWSQGARYNCNVYDFCIVHSIIIITKFHKIGRCIEKKIYVYTKNYYVNLLVKC